MEHLLNSKFIAGWGVITAGFISIDWKWLDSQMLTELAISPLFTNLYMALFGTYYVLKMYWYWQDKKLDKREREQKMKNNNK